MNEDQQLPAGNGANHSKRLIPRCYLIWQCVVRRYVRKVFPAGKKTQVRASLVACVVANRSSQHRITLLQRIKNSPLSDRPIHFQFYLRPDSRQIA